MGNQYAANEEFVSLREKGVFLEKTDVCPVLLDDTTLLAFTQIFKKYAHIFWSHEKAVKHLRFGCYRAVGKLWNWQLNKTECAMFIKKYIRLYKFKIASVVRQVSQSNPLQSALKDAPKWVQLLDSVLHYSEELLKQSSVKPSYTRAPKSTKPPNLLASVLKIMVSIYKTTDGAMFLETVAKKLQIDKIDVMELWTSAILTSQVKYWAWRRNGDLRGSPAPAPTRAEWRLIDCRAARVNPRRERRETIYQTNESLRALEVLLTLIDKYKAEKNYTVESWRRVHNGYLQSGRDASVIILQLRWQSLKIQSVKEPKETPFLNKVRKMKTEQCKSRRNRTIHPCVDFLENDFGDVDPIITDEILKDDACKNKETETQREKHLDEGTLSHHSLNDNSDDSSEDETLFKIKVKKDLKDENAAKKSSANINSGSDSDSSRNLVIDDECDDAEQENKDYLEDFDKEIKREYEELYRLVNSESISLGVKHFEYKSESINEPCKQSCYNSDTDVKDELKDVHKNLPDTLLELNELDPEKIHTKIIMESDSDDDLTNDDTSKFNSKIDNSKDDKEISIVNIRTATENNIFKVGDVNYDIINQNMANNDSMIVNDIDKFNLKNEIDNEFCGTNYFDKMPNEINEDKKIATESYNENDNDITIHETRVKTESMNDKLDKNISVKNEDEDVDASRNEDISETVEEKQSVSNQIPDLNIKKLLMQPQVVLSPCKYITKYVASSNKNSKLRNDQKPCRKKNMTTSLPNRKCNKTELIRTYNLKDLSKNPDYDKKTNSNTHSKRILDLLSKCSMVTVDIERIDINNLDKYIAPLKDKSRDKIKNEINLQNENDINTKTDINLLEHNDNIVEHSTNSITNKDLNRIPTTEVNYIPERRRVALPDLAEIRKSQSAMQMAAVAPINIVKHTTEQSQKVSEANVTNADTAIAPNLDERDIIDQMMQGMDLTLKRRLRTQSERLHRCLKKVQRIFYKTPLYRRRKKTVIDTSTPTEPTDALAEWIRQKNCNKQYFNIPGVKRIKIETKDTPKTIKNPSSKKQVTEPSKTIGNVTLKVSEYNGIEISKPSSSNSNVFQENRKREHPKKPECVIIIKKKPKDNTSSKIIHDTDILSNQPTLTIDVHNDNLKRQMTDDLQDVSNKKVKDTDSIATASHVIDTEQKSGESLVNYVKKEHEVGINTNKTVDELRNYNVLSDKDSETKDLSEVTAFAANITNNHQNTNSSELTRKDVVEISSEDEDLVIDESKINQNASSQVSEENYNIDINNKTTNFDEKVITFSNYMEITPQFFSNIPTFKITTNNTVLNPQIIQAETPSSYKHEANPEFLNKISISLPNQSLNNYIPNSTNYLLNNPTPTNSVCNSTPNILRPDVPSNTSNHTNTLESRLSIAKVVKRTKNGPILAIAPLEYIQPYKNNSHKFVIVRDRPTTPDPPQSMDSLASISNSKSGDATQSGMTLPLNINVKQLQDNPNAPKMSLNFLTSRPPLTASEVLHLQHTDRTKYILRIDTTRPIWQIAGGKLVLTSEDLWCRSEEYVTLDEKNERRPVIVFKDKNVIDLTSADETNCWSKGPLYVCVFQNPTIYVQVLTVVWSPALCANLVAKNASIFLFSPDDGKLFSTKVNLNITQQNA